MDAEERAAALRHADGCATCAGRLAEERALSAALRMFASASLEETEQVRPRMEAALLSGFRARHAAATSHETNGAQTSAISEEAGAEPNPRVRILAEHVTAREAARATHAPSRWLRAASAAAAAAVVLAFVGIIASRAWQTGHAPAANQSLAARTDEMSEPRSNASQALPAASMQTMQSPLPTAAEPGAGLIKPEQMATLREASDGEAETGDAAWSQAAAAQRRAVRDGRYRSASLARNAIDRPENLRNPSRPQAGAAAQAEIATDFFSLTGESTLAQMDGGHVVRVELPRSALVSMGLPMNGEQLNERVKADVLLGHDGVARAIRFVR